MVESNTRNSTGEDEKAVASFILDEMDGFVVVCTHLFAHSSQENIIAEQSASSARSRTPPSRRTPPQISPRFARFRISAPVPKVHGSASAQ